MLDKDRYLVIDNFELPQLGRTRTIRVYLPKDYHNSDSHYPVVYMHDGQNLFDSSISYGGDTWEIPRNVDSFFEGKDGVIVVGIDNGSEFDGLCRMYEYSPWKMDQDFILSDWDPLVYQSGGDGARYIEFITDTLKPYIDQTYRTKSERDNTVIAGSSMGGFISLFGIMQRPDVFSKAGVFSPAFWFNKPAMFDYLQATELEQEIQVYMDMGTQESSGRGIGFEKIYLDGSNEANALLETKANIDLKYIVDEGAQHTESAWAKRYPEMLSFFFK
ncbi:alpha-dextrin endo-1, 6-alpha-glucosidase [Vibrio ishigakensis]|uniref:Alpha-dextrin endo-1, 6-alpha-glucosidase n=1 Tax=Vibrio ishigakensis TaxID=1481914 RepID=A0A0B8P9A5_9VIBR|nr:alpha/beta hydrolase-fold protein [Vibrio ishigakensis]GAM59484.1 alpha-dextrin endo-1, 6-alpha-glucosidase [Vibrio ishigakensis]